MRCVVINKQIIVGFLGQDVEMRYTQAGTAVASFSVASTESWKDQSGEWQKKTEWHRCAAWAKLGEICEQLLNKGSLVYIEGKTETHKWQDQTGADRYSTEVVVKEMKKLIKDNEGSQSDNGGGHEPPPSTGDDVPF